MMWSLFELFETGSFRIEILDIGAAICESPSYQPLVDAGHARITGFEPNPQECERLNQVYGGTHRFFPHFVGDGGPATFYETNWNLTGSLFEPNSRLLDKFQYLGEGTQLVAQHPVDTVCLDDLADLADIDFIKIDIQGGELAVFKNARRVLSGVMAIQTEVEFVELYKKQPLFADVDIFLRGQGFQFHTFIYFGSRPFKPIVVDGNPNKGIRQYLWSDAVYVHDWLRLEHLSELKLKKLAVIAHDILQSYDLAHLVLLSLDQSSGSDLAARYMQRFA
ncbi:MAG: FkbM family methyltransferase [Proteobacteria bacterium]|nr:FkbM family methyltransferase [Pseudomonadota bacterium]